MHMHIHLNPDMYKIPLRFQAMAQTGYVPKVEITIWIGNDEASIPAPPITIDIPIMNLMIVNLASSKCILCIDGTSI